MLTVAICDDNVEFAEWFRDKLKHAFDGKGIKCKIDVFGAAIYLTRALEMEYYDIICLDIQIGENSGIEIGNSIRDKQGNQKSQIVFVSSFPDYHHSGKLYDAAPMSFIRKPVNNDAIKDLVSKAINRIILIDTKDERYFSFSHDRTKSSLLVRDIICFERISRYVAIHTTDFSKSYKYYSSLAKISKELDNPDFIRIHQAFLMNIHHIKFLKSNKVICRTGQEFPVSETYYKDACWAVENLSEHQRRGDKQYV